MRREETQKVDLKLNIEKTIPCKSMPFPIESSQAVLLRLQGCPESSWTLPPTAQCTALPSL